MNEPVILKNSLSIALLTLLQRLVPALIAGGSLYVVNFSYGFPRTEDINWLATLSGVLLILLPRQRRTTETPIFNGAPLAFGALVRWGVVLALLLVIGFVTKVTESYPRRVLSSWALIMAPLLVLTTLILDRIMRRTLRDPSNARKTVFVGLNDLSMALANQLRGNAEFCMSVEGFFDDRNAERLNLYDQGARLLGKLQDLAAYVNANGVQVIFVALPMRHLQRVRDLLEDLRDTTASIYYVPDIFVFDLIQSRTGDINGMPIVALCETPFYGLRGVAKRLTDVIVSLLALIVLMPFLLVIVLLVKISSPGPAIFRQRRYGLDGREIVVYKFRTMKVIEDRGPIVQATRNDDRVTGIGRVLRRFSIDEIPQLLNVLQGRMSLVGPRPHAVAHNEEYRKLIKGYMLRHKVLPGITGLAQINGLRGETQQLEEMQARINLDLEYLRKWSVLLDLKILALTALLLLRREGKAY